MESLSARLFDCGVAVAPFPGEKESGDRHLIKDFPGGMLLAVVDGLGHGTGAAEAAKTAVRTISEHASESAMALFRRCHDALRGTRGVVMSLASFNSAGPAITWMGVGNVEGFLMRADSHLSPDHEDLLLRGGVVGCQLPPLRASVLSIVPGDTLAFATDGVAPDFVSEVNSWESPQEIASRILERHSKRIDDALALVARYRGRSH